MFEIACDRPWLMVTFACRQRMLSWSLNRPGFVDAGAVAWREVGDGELRDVAEPAGWLAGRLTEAGHGEAVGLLTARKVSAYVRHAVRVDGVEAECVITLGLNNGERVGRRTAGHLHPLNAGTINILCAVSRPLTDAALAEMSSVVTQARTVALVEAGYRRPEAPETVVTGTGTDCIVVSAPRLSDPSPYAGLHTAIGEAVGAAVLAATRQATVAWIDERRR